MAKIALPKNSRFTKGKYYRYENAKNLKKINIYR